MERPEIRLLITDLDNTLYDWIGYFVPSFYAMVEKASSITDIPLETLLNDLQTIHQRYRNTEHPFSLLEAQSVIDRYPGRNPEQIGDELSEAFRAFYKARKQSLALYPGVSSTLEAIRNRRTTIVAYTEARSINALVRIRNLELTKLLDWVYAPASSGDPSPLAKGAYPLDDEREILRLLKPGHMKPNAEVLLGICETFDVEVDKVLYVGDSQNRDISMARAAGTWSAWAKYGSARPKELWDKLVRITHWTREDVKKAEEALAGLTVREPHVILTEFADVLDHFAFRATRPTGLDST